MAIVVLDTQTPPTTPAANTGVLHFDSVSKLLTMKNDTGVTLSQGGIITNASIAATAALSADTYLVGSALAIPGHLMQAKTMFHWTFVFSKGAAGTASTPWNIRVGTGGVVGDASRVVFTQPADTAAADTACVDIYAIIRSIGSGTAGIMAGGFSLRHNTPGTDLAAGAGISGLSSTPVIQATSTGFDTTIAGTIVGVSVNPGANAYTFQLVMARAYQI